MPFTVRVVGIFTRNSRSSATADQRRARVLADVAAANAAWFSGFSPGVRCEISFVATAIYNSSTIINASTVAGVADPRVDRLIQQVRTLRNQQAAIYVVYLSGDRLADGFAVGNGGPRFTFFNSTASYGLVGHVVLTDIAGTTFARYVLAHEAGHVLFGRFLTNSPLSFTINDPSNPGSSHNNNSQNLMFPVVPANNPFINAAQCIVARRSKVLIENAASGAAAKRSNTAMLRRLNRSAIFQARKAMRTGKRKSR